MYALLKQVLVLSLSILLPDFALAAPAPQSSIAQLGAHSLWISETNTGANGTILTYFDFGDLASAVTDGHCRFPPLSLNDKTPPFPLNHNQPCTPPTYQYAFAAFVSGSNFNLTLSHTIQSQNSVLIKQANVNIISNTTVVDAMNAQLGAAQPATTSTAPAGWKGDAIVN